MNKFFEKYGRLIAVLAPTLFGVVFIVLCAVNLQQSVWFDESYGAYLTRFSYSEVWDLTYVDVHPPLYYFALKLWSSIFGTTDFAMRFMSVFFGAVAIVFAWQWIKRSFGLKPALLAILLMTISPMFVRYGQEMRMYTMAAAAVFSATYVLQVAMDTKKLRYWIIYGVIISLGMWTHYFTALVWLAHLAYLIYAYRKKIFQKNVLIGYAVAVLVYLPWMPGFLAQVTDVQGGFWVGKPTVTTITDSYTNAFVYQDSSEITDWLLVLTLAVLAVLIYLAVKARKKMPFVNFMAFAPVMILLLLSMPPLFKPLFLDRYIIHPLICVALVAGIGITVVKFKTKIVPVALAVLFIGTSVIGLSNLYNQGNYNKVTKSRSDLKAIFESVVASSEDGAPILSENEWKYYDMSFYETEKHPVYFLAERFNPIWGSQEPLVRTQKGRIDDFDAFLAGHEKVWWVADSPCGKDENGDAILTCDKELEFPREGYHVLQKIILNVGWNQAPLMAIEVSKTPTEHVIEQNS